MLSLVPQQFFQPFQEFANLRGAFQVVACRRGRRMPNFTVMRLRQRREGIFVGGVVADVNDQAVGLAQLSLIQPTAVPLFQYTRGRISKTFSPVVSTKGCVGGGQGGVHHAANLVHLLGVHLPDNER